MSDHCPADCEYGPWEDCFKHLPYFDFQDRFRIPFHTQRRRAVVDGKTTVQYRERPRSPDEWSDRQF